MLLDTLGEVEAGRQVENAVKRVVRDDLQSLDAGRMGHTTQQVGDLVVKYIEEA
jgi:3-isopropylmalate dehydrogenase